ncbi:hypothetical protein [Variovorax sp. AFSI2.2]|uniref:hypothetical protein n=1 Tax=Variovorax sp. AFSI2.2 TaxID=3384160 RepID=UPI003EBFCD24
MSNGGGKNNTPEFDGDGDDGTLRDPMLRRALDHAPDHDALPDPRTRDAIRKMAHNLATVPATPPAVAAPWWRRLFGGGGETHARMPWNAAFATVLVATFITVLWHREPVPDARLDGEAGVASAPTAASAPAPAPVPPAPAPAPAPAQPATEAARDAVSGGSPQRREDPVRRTAPAPAPSDKPAAPAPVIAAAPPPTPPSAPAVAPPSPAPMAEQSAPAPRAFPRAEERREENEPENRQRSPVAAGAPPAAAMAPAAPPSPRESADSSASPALSAAQRSASANSGTEASGALRQAPAARAPASAAAKASAEDTSAFSALDRWTSLNLMRAGQGVRQARGDTEGLAALVNAAARSATAPGAELAAPVEARLELYRGATLLAVLEVAGDQVRWTPQAAGTGGGATVGTPPASTLAALRAVLARQ